MDKKLYAVILAAGEGRRMGSTTAKQYIEIGGKPILRHTVEKFLALDTPVEIILVLPPDNKAPWKEYCERTGFLDRYIMVSGGITRFHSVKNAMKYIPDGAIVAVHDGVRPFITTRAIKKMLSMMDECEALVPVVSPVETLRMVEDNGSSFTVDRSRYTMVQTPQMFRSETIKLAYSQPYETRFTDDASVVEAAGRKVTLCEGSRLNIKITTPEDLEMAEAICAIQRQDRT